MDSANPIITWRVHPAKERRAVALAASIVILTFAYLTYVVMNNPGWGVFAATILAATLNRFFFPSRFVIDTNGVTAQYPWKRRHYRWAEIRRFLHDNHGGYLSTRARASVLDAYSGMHLIFADNREAVVTHIERHLRKDVG